MEKWRAIRDSFRNKGLKKTLLEEMLWNLPMPQILSVNVDGQIVEVEVLAELPGAAFLQAQSPDNNATSWFRRVDKELSKRFPERLIRFQSASGDSWFWPKKLASGSLSYERLDTAHERLPDYLAQRLAGLCFSPKEHQVLGLINPVLVKEKIRGQFESAKVTSEFYKKFKEKHEHLSNQISGVPDSDLAASYSTLLLNRLMFIYFLQKKEFLNEDPNYLQTCLKKVQELQGKDKFYSFYRDYLLELFFNKLDNPKGKISDPIIDEIAGDVPYVNGGVFGMSIVEREYDVSIPDSAFEDIFQFFDSYTWHLDTRPTGSPNEVNPEVIGYIFEQYINFTAEGKRENGAYYTKHDVTGYMVGQTLVPRILDEVISLGVNPFDTLISSPDTYLYESLKHGWDAALGAWKPTPDEFRVCWEGDPIAWSLLDNSDADPEICLPDETWVEMFARRERVDGLKELIRAGGVTELNQLITLNLNGERLLADVIVGIQTDLIAEKLWSAISDIKIIDPTCGSGAFLFAALEVLEVVYNNVLERLEALNSDSSVLEDLSKHPNRRYFLRKHAALRNLFGIDIMPDAIETAKLRIFLALVSCLEKKSDLEPLPDLDFNLKVGNFVVGFVNAGDVSRVDDGRLLIENRLAEIEDSLEKHLHLYENFLKLSAENSSAYQDNKVLLQASEKDLLAAADAYYAECTGKSDEEFKLWAEDVQPFHWSIQFPAVFAKGGFDVVIGNPPYIKKSEVPASTRASLLGFETQDLPDFYAVCLERADQIRNMNSRKSMIVMLSFAFSDSFEKSRDINFSLPGQEVWLATFGKRPDALFRGVQVRNTILTHGPGSGLHGTSHQIFNAFRRKWLFDSLSYQKLVLTDSNIPVRAGLASELAKEFLLQTPLNMKESGSQVYLRPTGQYWLPVLPSLPPVLDSNSLEAINTEDPGVNAAPLDERENAPMVIAMLAGKLGFLWWSSTGDDFHTIVSQTIPPRRLLLKAEATDKLRSLAEVALREANNAVFGSKNAGAVYLNIRWSDLNKELDAFARELLSQLGLFEHWRALNIWYRMTMRSSGENTNSVSIPKVIIKSFLDS